MRRRAFVGAITATMLTLLLDARAQKQAVRVGLLGVPPPGDPAFAPLLAAFVETMRQKGWIEGRNIAFDHRWSGGRPESYSTLAAELVATRPDLIIALSAQAVSAAHQQSEQIPIVAVGGADLVALGLVASHARPGGNITGFSVEGGSLGGKWLQILAETHPGMSRVAVIYTPANPASKLEADKSVALAHGLGVTEELIGVDAPNDLDGAFAAIGRSRPEGLIVHATPATWGLGQQIAAFAVEQRLPSITQFDAMARDGLMLSYSPDYLDIWRRTAGVVDKILRGARPADIPVEEPTKFSLVINLKTARAIGVDIPRSLLAQADVVIE